MRYMRRAGLLFIICRSLPYVWIPSPVHGRREYNRHQKWKVSLVYISFCDIWGFIHWNRHPLQELVVDTFVPNDIFLIGGDIVDLIPEDDENTRERNSIVICTGANACGKVCPMSKPFSILSSLTQFAECILEAGWSCRLPWARPYKVLTSC